MESEPVAPVPKRAGEGDGRAIRLATKCASVDEFVALFHPFVDATSIVIPGGKLLAVGDVRAFEIVLKDGSPVMRGRCAVTDLDVGGTRASKAVRAKLLSMDAATTSLHRRLLAARPSPAPERGPAKLPAPRVAATLAVAKTPSPVLPSAASPAAASPAAASPAAASMSAASMSAASGLSSKAPPQGLKGLSRTSLGLGRPAGLAPATPPPPEPTRAPGAAYQLPANPFSGLSADSLASFVECTLFEGADQTPPRVPDTAPDPPEPQRLGPILVSVPARVLKPRGPGRAEDAIPVPIPAPNRVEPADPSASSDAMMQMHQQGETGLAHEGNDGLEPPAHVDAVAAVNSPAAVTAPGAGLPSLGAPLSNAQVVAPDTHADLDDPAPTAARRVLAHLRGLAAKTAPIATSCLFTLIVGHILWGRPTGSIGPAPNEPRADRTASAEPTARGTGSALASAQAVASAPAVPQTVSAQPGPAVAAAVVAVPELLLAPIAPPSEPWPLHASQGASLPAPQAETNLAPHEPVVRVKRHASKKRSVAKTPSIAKRSPPPPASASPPAARPAALAPGVRAPVSVSISARSAPPPRPLVNSSKPSVR